MFLFSPPIVSESGTEIAEANRYRDIFCQCPLPSKIDLYLWSISGDVGVLLSAFGHCSKNVTSIRLAGMIRSRESRAVRPVCLLFGHFFLNYLCCHGPRLTPW